MPGGRERNIMRWELRVSLLREQIARLDERLARPGASNGASPAPQSAKRDDLLAQRAELARQLDAMGPDPRAKMG
jgi:hypothetical protein